MQFTGSIKGWEIFVVCRSDLAFLSYSSGLFTRGNSRQISLVIWPVFICTEHHSATLVLQGLGSILSDDERADTGVHWIIVLNQYDRKKDEHPLGFMSSAPGKQYSFNWSVCETRRRGESYSSASEPIELYDQGIRPLLFIAAPWCPQIIYNLPREHAVNKRVLQTRRIGKPSLPQQQCLYSYRCTWNTPEKHSS